MGNLNQFFRDLGRNAYGLGENVASLGSAAIAEPVAGFAAMYDPANGAQAIRDGMTYTPRTQAGQMYQQGAARTLGAIAQPAMPVIDTWQRGVDIAGGYSPMAGAMLRTVPAAIGVAMGAKPALQAGRQVSNSLGAMQSRMVANANAPRTLNAGYMGQRGAIGTQRPLTEFEKAHLTAQRNAALPVEKGGLGLPADNTAMDRARAMGFDVDNGVYHGTGVDINEFRNDLLGSNTGAPSAKLGHFFAETPHTASQYARTASKLNVDDGVVFNEFIKNQIDRFNNIEGLPNDFKINSIDDFLNRKELLEQKREIIRKSKKGDWLGQDDKEKIRRIDSIEYQWDNTYTNALSLNNSYLINKYGDDYRALTPREGARTIPIFLKKGKNYLKDFDGRMYRDEKFSDLMKKAKDSQHDSVTFANTFDPADIDIKRTPENIYAVFDPKNIRSRFAAFDPFNRNSSNLLAQSAKLAPAATLGALMANEKRKDKRN